MSKKVEWYTYHEKPQPNSLVLVEKGEDGLYIDKIGDNFDEWAVNVIKWAYISDLEKEEGDVDAENREENTIYDNCFMPSFNFYGLPGDSSNDSSISNGCCGGMDYSGYTTLRRVCEDAVNQYLFGYWKVPGGFDIKDDSGEHEPDGELSRDEKNSTESKSISDKFDELKEELRKNDRKISLSNWRRINHIIACIKCGATIDWDALTKEELWKY